MAPGSAAGRICKLNRAAIVALELVAAACAILLAVWCWDLATVTSSFGPVALETPSFERTEYSGAWIAGGAALLVVAGLFVIDAIHRHRTR